MKPPWLVEDAVGRVQTADHPRFAGLAIVQRALKTPDASLGLEALRSEEEDAELLKRAAELSRLLAGSKLFIQHPVVVIAGEDAAAPSSRQQAFGHRAAEGPRTAASRLWHAPGLHRHIGE